MIDFWELSPSPNNTKVRMALRYKGIEFRAIPVDPFDRTDVLRVSGQELTPVIVDRDRVINDSEAILQYLDANYPDTPRLFPTHREGRRECDDFKSNLDAKIVKTWSPVFLYAIKRSETWDAAARDGFEELLAVLEGDLQGKPAFGGSEMPICDLRVAEWATYALPGAGLVERVPLFKRFRELFAVERGRYPRLEAFLEPWNERLA